VTSCLSLHISSLAKMAMPPHAGILPEGRAVLPRAAGEEENGDSYEQPD